MARRGCGGSIGDMRIVTVPKDPLKTGVQEWP